MICQIRVGVISVIGDSIATSPPILSERDQVGDRVPNANDVRTSAMITTSP